MAATKREIISKYGSAKPGTAVSTLKREKDPDIALAIQRNFIFPGDDKETKGVAPIEGGNHDNAS